MTITQKIIASHCKRGFVKPGEVLLSDIDLVLADHASAEKAADEFERYGFTEIYDSKIIALIPEQLSFSENDHLINKPSKLHEFVRKHDIEHFYEKSKADGEKISITESGLCVAGDFIIGDSRTCACGALGAFSLTIGISDLSFSFATGKIWLKVPEAIRVQLDGVPKATVSGMDIILTLIGMLGKDGKNRSLEFGGDSLTFLNMDDRFTIAEMANSGMAKESGVFNCIFECDYQTLDFIGEVSKKKYKAYFADGEDDYKKVITLDLSGIEPACMRLSSPSDIKRLSDIERDHIKISKVVIGPESGGRLSDLRDAARILKDKKISPDTKVFVIPESDKIYRQAMEEGLIGVFLSSGCTVLSPKLSFPVHMRTEFSGVKEAIAVTDRSFFDGIPRGDNDGYLLSPISAAACALKGYLC